MKKDFGKSTHLDEAMSPVKFRAQATGVGQTQAMSEATGRRRAQFVADTMPAAQRAAVPASEGYPLSTPDMGLGVSDYPAARRGRANC